MISFLDKYSLYLSFCILLVCVLTVMAVLGIGLSFDTNSYDGYATEIILHKFNILSFIKDHYPRLATYSVPIYIMGTIKFLFGESWKPYYLALNFICVAAMAWRFSSTLRQLGIDRISIAIGIGLATISIDHIIWPRFVLTDTLYSAMILYAFTLPIHCDLTKTKHWVWFVVLMLTLMVTRPTALPVVLACIAFAMSYYLNWLIFKPKWTLIVLGILVAIFTLIWAYFFHQYAFGNITPSKNLDYIYRFVESGAIVTERPGSSIVIEGIYSDYVLLYVLRLIYFFSPYSSEFSFIHNLCNAIWLCSFFISLVLAYRFYQKGLLSRQHRTVIASLIILIVAATCYHSAILLDYDWRYRYPLILPMLMIVSMVISTGAKHYYRIKKI